MHKPDDAFLRTTNEPIRLDELDQRIIVALEDDGRRPYREIARELGAAEATIRSRVRRMIDRGWIRIAAVGDPLRLGVPVTAITLLRVQPGASTSASERLAEMPDVRFVASTFGSADMIIQTLHPSVGALHEFLSRRLPERVAGIASMETFQVAQVHKSAWNWRAWFAEDGPATDASPSAN